MDKNKYKVNIGKGIIDDDKRGILVFIKCGVVVFAVIIVIAASLLIYFNLSKNYVATVGGEKITITEYKYYLKKQKGNMLNKARMTDPDTDEATFWNTEIDGENALEVAKKSTLETIKNKKVQFIKAKEKKFKLTDKEFQNTGDITIRKIISVTGGGNREVANSSIERSYGISLDDIRNIIVENTLVEEFRYTEIENMKVSADDIKDYYKMYPEWYKSNTQARMNCEEAVWVRHIYISVANDAKQEERDAAKKKMEDLLVRLKSGEDFIKLSEEVAKDFNTGDYLFGKGKMMPEFEKVSFSLVSGQIYDTLVWVENGYEIIKLEEKYAKDQPVSLKCVTEYHEFGTEFLKEKLYQEQLYEWEKDDKFDIIVNEAVYNSIN